MRLQKKLVKILVKYVFLEGSEIWSTVTGDRRIVKCGFVLAHGEEWCKNAKSVEHIMKLGMLRVRGKEKHRGEN